MARAWQISAAYGVQAENKWRIPGEIEHRREESGVNGALKSIKEGGGKHQPA